MIPLTTAYTAVVENGVISVTVTPIAGADTVATITVNGDEVDSGVESSPITLLDPPTTTTITVEVTAQNRTTTETYTIDVQFEANTTPSFGVGDDRRTIDEQIFVVNVPVEVTLTEAVSGGNGTLTYTLSPALPPDLTYDANELTITGTPSQVFTPATYTYTVMDIDGDTDSTTFTIAVDPNAPPTANAGDDRFVDEGAFVTLTGSGTDPEGAPLEYLWTQVDQVGSPTVTLTNGNTSVATFTAPPDGLTVDALLTFSLTVNDGVQDSAASEVVITVTATNDLPTAEAGVNQSVAENTLVTLTGSGTDPEGQPLTYSWEQVDQVGSPTVTLTNEDTSTATFTAPAVTTGTINLTFNLTVTDPGGLAGTNTVAITVNAAPTANITVVEASTLLSFTAPNFGFLAGETVTVNGTNSTDPAQMGLTYQWTGTGGAAFTDSTIDAPGLTLPDLPLTGSYAITLVVTDGLNQPSEPVMVTLNIDRPVMANAGVDQTATTGGSVTLNGGASVNHALASADPLTYSWMQTDGSPTVVLTNETTSMPTFTAPTTPAVLTFSLTVSGSYNSIPSGSTNADTVTVAVTANQPPIANAGLGQSVAGGATVTLDGSASNDPEGAPLDYRWTQVDQVGSPTVILTNETTSMATFTAPAVTTGTIELTFSLTVDDRVNEPVIDTVAITVNAESALRLPSPGTLHVTRGHNVNLRLPGAVGGSGTYTEYTLTGGILSTLDLRLDFAPDLPSGPFRALFGFVPRTAALSPGTALYSVTDSEGATASVSFEIIPYDTPELPVLNDVTYTVGEPIELTLPTGTVGRTGAPPQTYTLSGDIPTGLSFNSETRVLSGTVMTASPLGGTTLTYELADANDARVEGTFVITITSNELTAEAGEAQGVTEGATVTLAAVTLAGSGTGLTYSWTQINAGASEQVTLTNDNTSVATFTAPTGLTTAAVLTFMLTVTDGISVPATDNVTVTVYTELEISDTVDDRTFTAHEPIEAFTLTAATGGSGDYTYSVSLPRGLVFDPDTRIISGTPVLPEMITLTYTALDVASNASAVETFAVTITANPNDFVTTWRIPENDPTNPNNQRITIPIFTGETYDYTVDWGDGQVSDSQTEADDTSHTYASAGDYEVRINGLFPRIYFNNRIGGEKIIAIDQWGNQEWSSMNNAFAGALNLSRGITIAIDPPNLASVTDMSGMFRRAPAFNQDISDWDVSRVTNMSGMFLGALAFNQDIGTWAVDSVANMNGMFADALAFNQDIGGWNVGSVTDMSGMFAGADAFNQDIGGWNVGNVTEMSSMFADAVAFDQDIGGWNVGNVTDMSSMFADAVAFNQDISAWDVSRVANMNGMFADAVAFDQDISGWNVGNVTDMSSMFAGADAFNQAIDGWNVGNVTDISGMFAGADAFNQAIDGWNVGNVTDMSSMFAGADVFNQNIGGWDVSSVITMAGMFASATSFNQNIGGWNVSSVAVMTNMLDGSGLDVPNYNALLIGWSTIDGNETGLQTGVVLGAEGARYCGDAAIMGRGMLTGSPYDWTINGDSGTAGCSTDASLSALSINPGSLSLTPLFVSTATSYTATVAVGVPSVRVTATATDSLAVITVNGDEVDNEGESGPITLVAAASSNTITVAVTAQDGTTMTTYIIDVEFEADTDPTFGDRMIANQEYLFNVAVMTIELPAASGGNGALTYSLSPDLPLGLVYAVDSDTGTGIIRGIPAGILGPMPFTYTVTDDDGDTAELGFTITVAENKQPTADAGMTQTVEEGDMVTLDGSGSSDPNAGDVLTYRWRQRGAGAGEEVDLNGMDMPVATFTVPSGLPANTELNFRLTVTDLGGLINRATVTIRVPGNLPPIANAGENQNATPGTTVTLDGSGSSDPDGDSKDLEYEWEQRGADEKDKVTLIEANTVSARFTLPENFPVGPDGTELRFRLTVTEPGPGGLTGNDTVSITVFAQFPPTAAAGEDRYEAIGTTVTLDGRGSMDPDGDQLTYLWEQLGAGRRVTLNGMNTAVATFLLPDDLPVGTELRFRLTVTDDPGGLTDRDTVTITAGNPPTAEATTSHQNAVPGDTVTLDARGSSDPDGDALTYQWALQNDEPNLQVTLIGADTSVATFTLPTNFEVGAQLRFRVTVTDFPGGLSTTSAPPLRINVIAAPPANQLPIANAGPTQTVEEGDMVTLDGRGSSDPEGQPLTYQWTQTGGTPTVVLTNADTATPTFIAPQLLATTLLTFNLTVTDDMGVDSVGSIVIITVRANTAPTADAGLDRSVRVGNDITLDGRNSTDSDGTIASYLWTVDIPALGTFGSNSTTETVAFTANQPGMATVTLTVTDNDGATDPDTVSIDIFPAVSAYTLPNPGNQNFTRSQDITVALPAATTLSTRTLTYALSGEIVTRLGLTLNENTRVLTGNFGDVAYTAGDATYTASDALGEVARVTFAITPYDTPLLPASIPDAVTYTASVRITPLTLPTGTTGRTGAPPQTYTLSGTIPTGLFFNATDRVLSGIPTTPASAVTLTYRVEDANGAFDEDTFTVTIEAAPTANRAPTAIAGLNQSVAENTLVTLDGSTSSDPDGDALTYAWTQVGPSTVTLTNETTSMATFTAPSGLTDDVVLTFTLTVTDDPGGLSHSDTVEITVSAAPTANQPPIANAGNDREAMASTTVTLDASASTDPEGAMLTYAWMQLNPTAANRVTFTGGTTSTSMATFTVPSGLPANTELNFSLTVTDPGGLSHTATVMITVTAAPPANRAPTAIAGLNQSVAENTLVTLDGSTSSDPDGDALTYAWTQVGPSTVTLTNQNTSMATFTAPTQLLITTALTFRLTVTDLGGLNDTAEVTITVNPGPNDPPTANAGDPRTVDEGTLVTLNGSGTDPEGQPLSYLWAQVGTQTVNLTNETTSMATFTAPSGLTDNALLTFSLIVNDQIQSSALADTVVITVNAGTTPPANRAPTANAGDAQSVRVGNDITLDGRNSTDDDTIASYLWTVDIPALGTFGSNSTTETVAFTANQPGMATVTLRVTDNDGVSGTADVSIDIFPATSAYTLTPPDTQNFTRGQVVSVALPAVTTLSTRTLTYALSGDIVTRLGLTLNENTRLLNGNFGDVAYTAGDATYTASDALGEVASVTFAIIPYNTPLLPASIPDAVTYTASVRITPLTLPTGTTGRTGAPPQTYTLSGTIPTGLFFNATDRVLSGIPTTPASAVTLTYRLEDANGAFDESTFTVTIEAAPTANQPPIANAGLNQSVAENTLVTLDGSTSSDPDGDALTYAWTQVGPSTVTLTNETTSMATFTAPSGLTDDVVLTFTLTVTDDPGGLSHSDTVEITVSAAPTANQPPIANAGNTQTVNEGASVTLNGSGSTDPEGQPPKLFVGAGRHSDGKLD